MADITADTQGTAADDEFVPQALPPTASVPPGPTPALIDKGLPPTGHIPVLDGVRGLAVLLVMAHHETVMTVVTRVDRVFMSFLEMAWCGVDLFFVLSGFLITGILLKTKEEPHYFRNFYARRVLRIFPLYYLLVIVFIVVLPHFHHAKMANFGRIAGSEVWYWLFLSNFSIAWHNAFRHAPLDVTWSLAIEEQFYLVWPAVVLLCSRRTLARLCWILIGAALAIRVGFLAAKGTVLAISVLPFTRMDTLAAGALVAVLFHGGWDATLARRVALRVGLIALGIVVILRGGYFVFAHLHAPDLNWPDPSFQSLGLTALALGFAAMLALTLTSKSGGLLNWFFAHPFMRFFGRYSYALYLCHLPIRAAFRDTIFKPAHFTQIAGSPLPGQLAFYVVTTAASVVAALLSWHLYEKHFLKLKRYFVPGR